MKSLFMGLFGRFSRLFFSLFTTFVLHQKKNPSVWRVDVDLPRGVIIAHPAAKNNLILKLQNMIIKEWSVLIIFPMSHNFCITPNETPVSLESWRRPAPNSLAAIRTSLRLTFSKLCIIRGLAIPWLCSRNALPVPLFFLIWRAILLVFVLILGQRY